MFSGTGDLTYVCVRAFFQLNGLESREAVCRELSMSPSQLNKNCPLLLELVKRGRQTHNKVRAFATDPLSLSLLVSVCMLLLCVCARRPTCVCLCVCDVVL